MQFDAARWKPVLENYRIDGKPVFDLTLPAHRAVLERFLALAETPGREPKDLESHPLYSEEKDRIDFRVRNRSQMERACREAGADAITDDTLGHEYRWWQ